MSGDSSWLARLFLVASLGMLCALPSANAQPDDPTVPPEEAIVPKNEEGEGLFHYIFSDEYRPFHSILVERETPLLGITWGGSVLWDTPLNGEPEGASTTLRQAKLAYKKVFNDIWTVRFTANYNNAGDFELGSNYAIYNGWTRGTVKMGVFDPAFSLEMVSSREGLTFMERALPVEALSERQSGGFALLHRTETSILNAGLFLFSPDYEGQSQSGQSVVLHYVRSPLEYKDEIEWIASRKVWTGISFSYRTNASGSSTQFRSRPEVTTVDDYYVDTGEITGAREILRVGMEASQVAGRASWQAELLASRVRRKDRSDTEFWGAYLFASWFLTDDSRHYDPLFGTYRPLSPNKPLRHGGWGAWEIAGRLSYVDLNSRNVIGGSQANMSLGVNWYINDKWRLMLNLIKVIDVNRPGSEYDGLDPLSLSVRAQWYLP